MFTFRQGCSYRMRLEAWFAHDHAAMGRAMEIESYPGMQACVIAGSGVALMSESMLASLPGAKAWRCTLWRSRLPARRRG
ncbi:LysR substrate-binding domain-containing protein [Pseudomonas sp. MDT2-39-1]